MYKRPTDDFAQPQNFNKGRLGPVRGPALTAKRSPSKGDSFPRPPLVL
jgi:hypothetical protein